MGLLNRLIIVFAVCTALLCCVAMCFSLNWLMALLATCASVAASAMILLNRRNKLRCRTSTIPAEAAQAVVLGLPDYRTGLDRRAFQVQEKLTNAPVLGIVGMGGLGKTTIAKQVFNSISPQFEYTCFVDNVEGIEPHKLNDWLLNHFFRNGIKADGNSMQWSKLQGKKTMIVMDDVHSETQFKDLPTSDHFGTGSRLIVTSRNRSVLSSFVDYDIYDVEFLDLEEAKKLFCLHVFQEEAIPDQLRQSNHKLEENVKRVVQTCGGLPLALEVLGCYLKAYKTNGEVWTQTIDRLGEAESINGFQDDRLGFTEGEL